MGKHDEILQIRIRTPAITLFDSPCGLAFRRFFAESSPFGRLGVLKEPNFVRSLAISLAEASDKLRIGGESS